MNNLHVNKEQITQAKQIDLLTYLQMYDPNELVRVSPQTFSTRTHDSLKISNGKWCWWSHDIGGKSALDYLIKVKGMKFTDAVLLLCNNERGDISSAVHIRQAEKISFVLPAAYSNNNRVINYLLSRGIEQKLIDYCIHSKMLYEDTRHNCIFVGYNGKTPCYAMMRSTGKNSTYIGEVPSSDKKFSFSLSLNPSSDILFVFESAIDLLSWISLDMFRGNKEPFQYISLSGVYRPGNETTHLPVSLEHYLNKNNHVRKIVLCLDNDDAGRLAAKSITSLLSKRYDVRDMPPPVGKDYNDCLMNYKKLNKSIKTRGAKSASNYFKEDLSK